MAVIHQATINPTKDQLVGPWLPTRPWWDGISERGPVGTFRLDDPAGEVGIECFLFGSATGSTLFVPVTYRGAELAGAEAHLIGTLEHSVLGPRWMYDGCGDPVFVSTVVDTIRSGGSQATLQVHRTDGSVVERDPTATVRGTGGEHLSTPDPGATVTPVDERDRTLVGARDLTVAVARQVGVELPAGPALIGSYAGGDGLALITIAVS